MLVCLDSIRLYQSTGLTPCTKTGLWYSSRPASSHSKIPPQGMRVIAAGDNANGFGFRVLRATCATAGRNATLGLALAASLSFAGCIGFTGAPPGSGSSGNGSGPSGSSQPSQLSPSSSGLSFGNVVIGTSTSQLVTLSVAGNENITISGVATSGTGFSVEPKSNVILAPNQTLTISVSFQPKASGSTAGNLMVSSNASNSSLQISLSGDGVATGGSHSVTLNWRASSSVVVGYFVFRGLSAGNLTQLNAIALPSTSYVDKNVAGGNTYVYAVKSMDASNVLSNFSSTVTVKIPSP